MQESLHVEQGIVTQLRERLSDHRDAPQAQIDSQGAGDHDGRRTARLHPVPQGRPQSGEQFVDAERLGDIIVRATIQRFDLHVLRVARRQHDDGGLAPFPDVADQVQAVAVGKAKIEHDDVVGRNRQGAFGLREAVGCIKPNDLTREAAEIGAEWRAEENKRN